MAVWGGRSLGGRTTSHWTSMKARSGPNLPELHDPALDLDRESTVSGVLGSSWGQLLVSPRVVPQPQDRLRPEIIRNKDKGRRKS